MRHATAIALSTFADVAPIPPRRTQRLAPELARHLAAVVELVIQKRFTRARDNEPLPERQIAQAIGISQAALNFIRRRKGSAGIVPLLALRDFTGQSIDALLGFATLTGELNDPKAIAKLIARFEREDAKDGEQD